jgi:penicillin-binding protein 2
VDNLRSRGYVIIAFIGLVFLIFIGRLFSVQVLSEEYARRAERYVIKTKSIVPPRGNIYDRNLKVYVSNEPMFNMYITPRELKIPDMGVLRDALGMTQGQIDSSIARARAYSMHKESIFARYIDPETYGRLQEQLWNFSGISFSTSTKRYYKYPVGANVLGYISEVNAREVEASEGTYLSGDLIGKAGIERSHDSTLRGRQGKLKVLKDVHNREVGKYAHGEFDLPPVRGQDMLISLDAELQAFGEHLMQHKKGSIVAIEPSTGQVLAFVSAPAYDPNMLTGRDLAKNWEELKNDSLHPLYNRPLMARYPPGSIFKVAMALAALNESVITPETYYRCGGGFSRNRGKPGCRFHPHPLQLGGAIKYSCNSYFAATYMDFLHHPQYDSIYQSYNRWYDYMQQLGVGRTLDLDIPYEVAGLLPTASRYDRWYGHGRWQATTIISNAIGQGEILMTPLQMANMAAIIANRGKYLPPHFVVATRNQEAGSNGIAPWMRMHYDTVFTSIRREHFETVAEAMEQVVATGTARRAFIPGLDVCGKTGTVENPHGNDHAVFIAFAPKKNPQIAIAVVMENVSYGGGGTWAAPTAALMIEKYLRQEIKDKQFEYQRVLNANFLEN